MKRLTACVAIPASIWLVPTTSGGGTRFESEATVYMLSCDGEQTDGICDGNERTVSPLTYRVSVDEHSVRYSRMNDPGQPRRFPFCAIHDTRSWLCQWESADVPKSRFGIMAGRYVEITTCMTDAAQQNFYQVSVWRWWRVWLRERFFGSFSGSVRPHSSGHAV